MSPPTIAPPNDPTPPITITTNDCTSTLVPMSGVTARIGASTNPARPATPAPSANTSMNARPISIPSSSTISASSMPARTISPSRVLKMMIQTASSVSATMPITSRRYCG
jgi:hypothetical protein